MYKRRTSFSCSNTPQVETRNCLPDIIEVGAQTIRVGCVDSCTCMSISQLWVNVSSGLYKALPTHITPSGGCLQVHCTYSTGYKLIQLNKWTHPQQYQKQQRSNKICYELENAVKFYILIRLMDSNVNEQNFQLDISTCNLYMYLKRRKLAFNFHDPLILGKVSIRDWRAPN